MWNEIKRIAVTLLGSIGGACAGGPIGLGIGGVGGALIDYARAKMSGPGPTAMAAIPGAATTAAGSLPPGANTDAATRAVTLMLVGAATGHTTETVPGRYWLAQFQSSVNLPSTGSLDPQTRALLTLAVPNANKLPAVTILG